MHRLRCDENAIVRRLDADVVVIGAGAAGMAAAVSLGRRSLNTIVLEARDRIGGRVWSRVSSRAMVPAELGAEFIHGRADETMALLRDAGTTAVDTGGESWRFDEGGTLRADDGDFGSSTSIFDGVRALAADESVDQYLGRFARDATLSTTLTDARLFVEGFDAADPAIASVRGIADELRSGVDYAAARPIGGYSVLFDHLRSAAAAAGVQLRLSTVARGVSWRRGSVAVDATGDGGKAQTLRARAAIITLPVGVLRDEGDAPAVAFDPALPASKREALASIEMGHVVKVTLQFRTAFWERIEDERYRDTSFFRATGQKFSTYWTQYPLRSELIVAWVGGPKAMALRGASESDLVAAAASGFAALLSEPDAVRRELEGGFMHDWSDDLFARGAYSYLRVGGGAARKTLAAAVEDTLFFAGEAASTDGRSGTVNGALVTGERAAAEVAASMGALR